MTYPRVRRFLVPVWWVWRLALLREPFQGLAFPAGPSRGSVLPGPSPMTRPGVRPFPVTCPGGPAPWARPAPGACRAVSGLRWAGPTRGAGARAGVPSLPGPHTGRGRGLRRGSRGPGQAGRGLTDLPSRLRASGAHAGAAPGVGGGAAPSGSPPRAGEKNPSGV